MVFQEQSSCLHFYDPRKEEFPFMVTVAENTSKWQIVLAEKAKTLLAGLACPSEPDYKWILRSNQVQMMP